MSLPNLSINGQVAIITGGRQGLGKAIALTFAEAGADIAVCDKVIDDGKLELVVKEIQNLGRRALGIQTDVSSKVEVDNLIQKVMNEFGHIDILVNNAGVGIMQPLLEQDEYTWDTAMDVNLKGSFLCSQTVAKIMVNQKKGNIIIMTSVSGLSQGHGDAYAISKAGLIRMTRIMAWYLGKHNVRVNAIAPGMIATEMTSAAPPDLLKSYTDRIPMGRMGQPGEVGNAALFLASEASSYMTGNTLIFDGGLIA
jgi:NAD(P)-dependent dehydrogenase (short-subunit alcohol dehydrogenase family)